MTIPSFSLAKATAGHCGTGAAMNILNFFWGTDFDIQDTKNIETMIRFGIYHKAHRPSEFEIALFLAENHFQVEYFSSAHPGDFAFFTSDPE